MNIINRIKHRREINRAIRELSALSNETLRDIGIERGNIVELVEQQMMQADAVHVAKAEAARQESLHRDYQLPRAATA